MPNQLRPDLSERHISMIAFSATLGFGLTIRSGKMLKLAGPGGTLIIYAISSLLGWALMGPFVEMSSVVGNVSGPVWELPVLFVDSNLGVAMGYMYLFTYLMVYADEIGVTSRLFKFVYNLAGTDKEEIPGLSWGSVAGVPPGVWAGLSLVTSLAVNALPVKYYGELEYWFGYTKLIGLVVVIVAQIPINLAGKHFLNGEMVPANEVSSIGARYWHQCSADATVCQSTGSMTELFQRGNYTTDADIISFGGPAARLAAVWTGVTFTIFSFLGPATICVAAQEAQRRSQDLKSANRKTLLRLISLYMSGVFLVAFNVPYNHHRLHPIGSHEVSTGSNSPFIIAMAEAGGNYIHLAHFANVLFIFATWSCATSNMYVASRTLHSLALNGYVPEFGNLRMRLEKTTRHGVPLNALYVCTAFGLLGFLAVGDTPQRALDALQEIGTTFWLITFFFIGIAYIAFYKHVLAEVHIVPDGEKSRLDRDGIYADREFVLADSSSCVSNPASSTDTPAEPALPNQTATDETVGEAAPVDPESAQPRPPATRVVTKEIYPYRTHFQPVRSVMCIVATFLLVIFNGWWVFARRLQWAPKDPNKARPLQFNQDDLEDWVSTYVFKAEDFVSTYLPHLLFIAAMVAMKMWNWLDTEDGPPRLTPDTGKRDHIQWLGLDETTAVPVARDAQVPVVDDDQKERTPWPVRLRNIWKGMGNVAMAIWWWIY